MLDREQQLEQALSLIVMTNQAVNILRRNHGDKAAEDTQRAAVREFNLAIERARELLVQRRTATVASAVVTFGPTAPKGPCTVCGKPFDEHGSYPTCASHPYTADGTCQHVHGATCVGAECRDGCVRGRGIAGVQPSVAPDAAAILRELVVSIEEYEKVECIDEGRVRRKRRDAAFAKAQAYARGVPASCTGQFCDCGAGCLKDAAGVETVDGGQKK
jgi:hypothetical protein